MQYSIQVNPHPISPLPESVHCQECHKSVRFIRNRIEVAMQHFRFPYWTIFIRFKLAIGSDIVHILQMGFPMCFVHHFKTHPDSNKNAKGDEKVSIQY